MTEFVYVAQIAEITPNTRRGARGFVLPAATAPGNPTENTLLPTTIAELDRLGIQPRELVGDGGFQPGPTNDAIPPGTRLFFSGRHEPGSRRTRKRQARYRTGCEGRISHLKRRYGLKRSRLNGPWRPADPHRLGDPHLQPRQPPPLHLIKHRTPPSGTRDSLREGDRSAERRVVGLREAAAAE